MARNSEQSTGGFDTENTGGVLAGFLAEEDELDRRALWRLGSWGVASVAAVVLAVYANQSSIGWRRDQVATVDLARQAQQIQTVAKDSYSEARRLASAIETLNGDRDRLFSRVTVLEQGLDTATGAIARQTAAATAAPAVPGWPAAETAAVPALPPVVAPVATTAASAAEKPRAVTPAVEPAPATVSSVAQVAQNPPATSPPLMASKSIMAPPDAAAGKLIEPEASKKAEPEAAKKAVATEPIPDVVASVGGEAEAPEAMAPKIQRTEFGIDIGGANSVGGLRALWRGLLKSKSNAPLAALRPIIVIKEGNGGAGMQLRLIAGPFSDAAAAAKICAGLVVSDCETTVFDGQRLAMTSGELPAPAIKPAPRKRSNAKKPPAAEESSKKPEPTTLLSVFRRG